MAKDKMEDILPLVAAGALLYVAKKREEEAPPEERISAEVVEITVS